MTSAIPNNSLTIARPSQPGSARPALAETTSEREFQPCFHPPPRKTGRVIGLAIVPALLAGIGPAAATFTGPTSAYYLDQFGNSQSTVYVVQGTSVIRSFTTSYNSSTYNYAEANFAVSNVVTTNGFGSNFGPGTAGQYSLTGTPTGVSHTAQATPGYTHEYTYDGTSDGTHNYTVQYIADQGGGAVIQTDANWQNPIVLFSVAGGGSYMGIAYDARNNSLWFSGWGVRTIGNYSLSGTLLSSFDGGGGGEGALGYDAADDTLWFSSGDSNTLFQFSAAGVLLQQGTPIGLPGGNFLAGDFAAGSTQAPEPASMLLLGAGLAGLGLVRRRRAL